MGLIGKQDLISQLSPPLNQKLTEQLLDEFISMERRYIQRDWEPAELDGGHFSEIVARIFYHQDSGNLNQTKHSRDCIRYIKNDQVSHKIQPRHHALHVVQVLETIYKFRNQRGSAHITPTYSPNHMDSKFLIESVRWCINETLRIFWSGDREEVAKAIRELLQFDVPCIGSFEEALLVQRTDLSAKEEILVLLHFAGEVGFSRTDLGEHAGCSQSSVSRALNKLTSPKQREAIQLPAGNYRLTDLGEKRVREELADKLLLE